MKDLKDELIERGLVETTSVEDIGKVTGERRSLYVGFDPTGDSLHVGHLVPFMLARHLMEYGHKVIILVGGGTAMIGDPSGKSEERVLLDEEAIAHNTERISKQIESLFDQREFTLVDNREWLNGLTLLSFLRDVGKHFTVGSILKKDSVKNRLEGESGISYTEFSYSLLQAYDFDHLYHEHNCTLQIGGGDQWGNVSAGVDFVRRKTGEEVFGITTPLVIDKTTGKKFGKTAGGEAVWLDPEKTSSYRFYQFWLNTDDESVGQYLRLYTMLPLEEIEKLEVRHAQAPQKREAQRTLAREVTSLVHGEERSHTVSTVSDLLFGSQEFTTLSEEEQRVLADEIPAVVIPKSELESGVPLVDILVETSLAESKGEARRLIQEGSVSINNVKKGVEDAVLTAGDLVGSVALLKRGKKTFACVRVK